jgi:GTP-binding protein
MPHVVAIIGRPNVGKSTLFNRIVGERTAIVDDEPGVTRDRHYGLADWAGKVFTLIDTGGFVPASDDVFEKAIREQAEIAIDEASAIVFVVDATAGITPLDAELAAILRTSRKRIVLVVNKVDNDKRELDAAQFFALGLGEPVTLSALGGRKIGDFLDVVTAGFGDADAEDAADSRLKIAVVGKPNVGKSSLVNALLGQPRSIVTEVPGTTRDAIDSVLRYKGEDIVVIDTAGLRRKSRVTENIEFYSTLRSLKSIDRCDVAVLVVDVHGGMDRQDLRIAEWIAERGRGMLLAANKWDLVEKDDKTALILEKRIHAMLRIYDYAPVVFISALERQRIHKVIDLARQVHAEQTKRIATNKLNTTLLPAIAMTPPASVRGKEIKINYITQVKTRPPVFAIFSNEPKLIEDRYKRFLERKLREAFGFVGVPISLIFRTKR